MKRERGVERRFAQEAFPLLFLSHAVTLFRRPILKKCVQWRRALTCHTFTDLLSARAGHSISALTLCKCYWHPEEPGKGRIQRTDSSFYIHARACVRRSLTAITCGDWLVSCASWLHTYYTPLNARRGAKAKLGFA
ncbi:hypothetical protein NDU88_004296 [Pleurodeles waltl]|uniref:Uncharacterized protein n=1 Tax=Pleurodeles waltl TaxID=8319 RepID=A0AAV7TTS8_PLEWA|nr:hypothetical protein NDU88_004296 [Pleurodeles waltl]